MRLRKRRTGELTSEFTEPVHVSLQPDILEIKTAMTTCVQKLVNASRGFPRPEQSMAQTFGGTYVQYLHYLHYYLSYEHYYCEEKLLHFSG